MKESRIHFSIDDVKGIFKALYDGSAESIFETRMLSFLSAMHKRYGTSFHLFCTFRHGDYSLSGVSAKYRQEFMNNSNWLRFGFHCYDESDAYDSMSVCEFDGKFKEFQRELLRVTGQNQIEAAIRLHGFRGNKGICRLLRQKGVRILFSADDDRRNYYLDEKDDTMLQQQFFFRDPQEGIIFYRSCTRLEMTRDAIGEIGDYRVKQAEIIPVFTHEWMMDDLNVRKKLEECCRLEQAVLNRFIP